MSLNFVRTLFFLLFPLITLASTNSIKEITDQETATDLRYYPRILYVEPTKYGSDSRNHCPFAELKLFSHAFDIQQFRDDVAAMGDLIEPLRYWNLSPDCFDKDIHQQIKITENKTEGLALGITFSVGGTLNILTGVEIVLTKLDNETMSIALFSFEGAGASITPLPANVGLIEGLLQGSCPEGVYSYAGGFTNLNVGFDSWSFATGDFPPTSNKLSGCSSYVKLSGLAGLSAGISQTYYYMLSPVAYKIRGPNISKLIEWLNHKNSFSQTPKTK